MPQSPVNNSPTTPEVFDQRISDLANLYHKLDRKVQGIESEASETLSYATELELVLQSHMSDFRRYKQTMSDKLNSLGGKSEKKKKKKRRGGTKRRR